MWEYTDAVREHFLNPRNVGDMPDANGVGEVGSLACGDALKLFLRIEDDKIKKATFQTFGCASAIASSSALTEMIIGKSVDEAMAITNRDIATFLGGLPKEKMHCSVLGQQALEAAIRNYRGEEAIEDDHEHEGRLICRCFGVTEPQIVKAIKDNGLLTLDEVTNFTKAGGACGECHEEIKYILENTLAGRESKPLEPILPVSKAQVGQESNAPVAPLTNVQRMKMVMRVLEQDVRPLLKKDGGDIELIDVDGKVVTVALQGMCSHCPSSRLTLERLVQETLRQKVDPTLIIKEASL